MGREMVLFEFRKPCEADMVLHNGSRIAKRVEVGLCEWNLAVECLEKGKKVA